jgi:inosine/xanthosine triphosphatase
LLIFIKMKVNVGSKNPVKIEAVKEAFSLYFNDLIVEGFETDSRVNPQPKRLEEITDGAINRARGCFNVCDYSVGVESGIFPVNRTLTGYMSISCSAIYDGRRIVGIGLSPAFEYPMFVIEEIFGQKREVGKIFDEEFKTLNISQGGGPISILSQGRYLRKELHRVATFMALLPIINKELYQR